MQELGQCWVEFEEQAAKATRALEEKQKIVGDALQRLLDGVTELTSITVADPPHEGHGDITVELRTRVGAALFSIHEALSVCSTQTIGEVTHSWLTRSYEGVHTRRVPPSHSLSAVVEPVGEQVSKVFDTLSPGATAEEFTAAAKEADSVVNKGAFVWLTRSLESAVPDEGEREQVLSDAQHNIWDTAVKGARQRWDVMQGNASKPWVTSYVSELISRDSSFWAYIIWDDEEPRVNKGKEVYRGPPIDDSDRGPDVFGDSRGAERDG